MDIMNFLKTTMIAGTSLMMLVSCGQSRDIAVKEGSEVGFALSFFRSVLANSSATDNVSVSPYSAGVALSMLSEGASGVTLEELDKALAGCRLKPEDLSDTDSVVIKSANALWTDSGFSVKDSFVSGLAEDYDAMAESIDFSSPSAVGRMNGWARENTEGKIDNIVAQLTPDMVAIIANALYFKAPWDTPFESRNTREGIFHGVSGDADVSFMNRTGGYEYAEFAGNQMVRIPYWGERFAMTVLLPAEGENAGDMEQYVNEKGMEQALERLQYTRIKLRMPEFRIENSCSLIPALQSMGVKSAFTSKAELGGIADGPLAVSEVNQKTYLNVSEAGSEAAAVTTVAISLTSVRDDRAIPVMEIDRPFYYMISDTRTGRIYFIGRIVNL